MSIAYRLARPALFGLDPEKAHQVTFQGLTLAARLGILPRLYPTLSKPVSCFGLTFPNPVGLGAGLDKNGDYIDALAALGFGFIEIGTVTPRPQPGNPTPRLFRLPQAQAIINRMGFNNDGVDRLIQNVERAQYRGILGINIGKNATTPVEAAVDDYVHCLEKVYPYASYVTVNISSPNTQGLRSLQSGDALTVLLSQLKDRQSQLASQHGKAVPLLLKVAPDLTEQDVEFIAARLVEFEFDGLITTNTTIRRDAVSHLPHGQEAGGLSGAPVKAVSTAILQQFHDRLQGRIPLIGVGGILTGADAHDKHRAGASLCQLYSGLVYTGPGLIADCVRAW